MKRLLSEFAKACGGTLIGADRAYGNVSSDTRTIAAGDLFIALHGPRFNGNDFVAAAQAAGAAAAVVDRPGGEGVARILVADTQSALTRAGGEWRRRFAHPLVAVAGSNGKTTVKEMIAAILGTAGPTLSTRGNFNNHIGVPLTLLRLTDDHRFAVIEVGANHPGEVAALNEIVQPDVGIVTNAGAEHLEGFGSLEGVARAEGELFAGLGPRATAVINADDEFAPLWRGMAPGAQASFGIRASADYRATDIEPSVDGQGFLTRFALIAPAGRAQIELRLAGMHNVLNATGAAAAAMTAGATLEQVRAGLAGMRAVAGRLQFKLARGAWIIDDSYNANPSSMHAAIDVLAGLTGRRWLVIGDMGELGDHAERSHVELGRYAREHGVDRLFATGPLSALAVEAFGAGAQWFPDTTALAAALEPQLAADVRILIKGSRMNRLERVVDHLVGEPTAGRKELH